jgi:hypothetical protein
MLVVPASVRNIHRIWSASSITTQISKNAVAPTSCFALFPIARGKHSVTSASARLGKLASMESTDSDLAQS